MSRKRIDGGYFISFEGGEGSGKTSQINYLADGLMEQGYRVVTTREPGGTVEGEALRALLVQRESGNWNPVAETLLMLAARSMHVERVIKPALAAGKVVISDRFADSTMAYQGYGRGFALEKISSLSELVMSGFKPHLTFVLDVDVELGLSRSTKRLAAAMHPDDRTEDRFERMDKDFHERIRQGFLDIAKTDTDRCCVIDATQTQSSIAANLLNMAVERLSGVSLLKDDQ